MPRSLSHAILAVLVLFLAACSLPPDRPVTRQALMETRIYNKFIIKESPEEILAVLNADGEAILEAQRRGLGKQRFPVHVKILATSNGLEVLDYDR